PKINGKDRLFFLFNWEGLRERKALTRTPSLPLTAWRDGDFSGFATIYDPATRVFNAAGDVIGAPTAFPNNRIPANRIHPGAKKLLAFYPKPQQELTGPNYVNNEAKRINADQYTYRFDFNESSKSNWFFRHSISHELGYDPFAVPDKGINTDADVQQGVLAN